MELLQPLKTPYTKVWRSIIIFILITLSALVSLGPLALSFLNITNGAVRYALLALSILIYLLVIGYYSKHLQHLAQTRLYYMAPYHHIGVLFLQGLKLLIILTIYSLPYYLINLIPGTASGIAFLIYSILLLIFLPAMILNSAINDSFTAGFHYPQALRSLSVSNYVGAYIASIIVTALYGVIVWGIGALLFSTLGAGIALTIYYVVVLFFGICASFTTAAYFAQARPLAAPRRKTRKKKRR